MSKKTKVFLIKDKNHLMDRETAKHAPLLMPVPVYIVGLIKNNKCLQNDLLIRLSLLKSGRIGGV